MPAVEQLYVAIPLAALTIFTAIVFVLGVADAIRRKSDAN